MLITTNAEKPAFIKQKLPTEIIGIISGFSDFETLTAIRSTCSSVRTYVPLRKVVGFEEYKELVELKKIKFWRSTIENEKIRVFQERIHLDLHHEALSQDQVNFLAEYPIAYELCRIARQALDFPGAYKGIDLLFGDCYFLAAASSVGDLELLIQLLQVPLMDPGADGWDSAFNEAAFYGRLEIVQFLLRDPRVDPSSRNDIAIRKASEYGHNDVVQALLQDPRVLSSNR